MQFVDYKSMLVGLNNNMGDRSILNDNEIMSEILNLKLPENFIDTVHKQDHDESESFEKLTNIQTMTESDKELSEFLMIERYINFMDGYNRCLADLNVKKYAINQLFTKYMKIFVDKDASKSSQNEELVKVNNSLDLATKKYYMKNHTNFSMTRATVDIDILEEFSMIENYLGEMERFLDSCKYDKNELGFDGKFTSNRVSSIVSKRNMLK
ncbi:unnamed protein product [Gordionus sp. m RMFG-2023]